MEDKIKMKIHKRIKSAALRLPKSRQVPADTQEVYQITQSLRHRQALKSLHIYNQKLEYGTPDNRLALKVNSLFGASTP